MRLSFNRSDLAVALNRVAAASDPKSPFAILGQVMIERGDDGFAALSATNLAVLVTARVGVEGGIDRRFCLPAGLFRDIVSNADRDGIVDLDVGDKICTVGVGRSRFKIGVTLADDWPQFALPHVASVAATMECGELRNALSFIRAGLADEKTGRIDYFMQGALLDKGPAGMRVASTDRHVLRIIDQPIKWTGDGITVPTETIDLLRKMMPASGIVSVEAERGLARFVWDGGSIATKLVEATWPDFSPMLAIGTSATTTAWFDHDELARCATAVSLVAAGNGIACDVGDAEAVMATHSSTGSVESSVACRVDGEPMRIGLSPRYMKAMLEDLSGDTIRLKADGNSKPAMFTLEGHDDRVVVIAPRSV